MTLLRLHHFHPMIVAITPRILNTSVKISFIAKLVLSLLDWDCGNSLGVIVDPGYVVVTV